MTAANRPEASNAKERRARRDRALLQARLWYGNGALSHSCLVVQISTTGAKLAVDEGVPLPDRFHLAIAQKGIDCNALLVWRRGGEAAVAFLPPETRADVAAQDDRSQVRALQAENEMLRAKIAALANQLKQMNKGY